MQKTSRRALAVGVGAAMFGALAQGVRAQPAADAGRPDPRRIIGDLQALPGGIDELKAVEINGLKQWIHVRGADRRNPILLCIHGGPGSPMMPEAWTWERAWEDFFTVVQWDQRGAGKTYESAGGIGPRPLSVDLAVSDAKAVVAHLRAAYGQRKIFVLAHSWGTILGLTLAHEIPEQLYAYIGVSQMVGGLVNEEAGFKETLAEARRRGDAAAIKELESIAPYPGNGPITLQRAMIERRWDVAFGGMRYGQTRMTASSAALLSPDYSDADVAAIPKGLMAWANAFAPQLASVDFRPIVDYRCPLFFFAGVDDRTTPRALVASYVATLHAPQKRLFVIDHAAHFVIEEAPGLVLLDLVEHVRPLASPASARG